MNESNESTSASLLSYNVKNKKFKLIDEIESSGGNFGTPSLSVNADSNYMVVDLLARVIRKIQQSYIT